MGAGAGAYAGADLYEDDKEPVEVDDKGLDAGPSFFSLVEMEPIEHEYEEVDWSSWWTSQPSSSWLPHQEESVDFGSGINLEVQAKEVGKNYCTPSDDGICNMAVRVSRCVGHETGDVDGNLNVLGACPESQEAQPVDGDGNLGFVMEKLHGRWADSPLCAAEGVSGSECGSGIFVQEDDGRPPIEEHFEDQVLQDLQVNIDAERIEVEQLTKLAHSADPGGNFGRARAPCKSSDQVFVLGLSAVILTAACIQRYGSDFARVYVDSWDKVFGLTLGTFESFLRKQKVIRFISVERNRYFLHDGNVRSQALRDIPKCCAQWTAASASPSIDPQGASMLGRVAETVLCYEDLFVARFVPDEWFEAALKGVR